MIADPGSIPFQTAATVGQAVDAVLRRWRRRAARRRAEQAADENWISLLVALTSEVHAIERDPSD